MLKSSKNSRFSMLLLLCSIIVIPRKSVCANDDMDLAVETADKQNKELSSATATSNMINTADDHQHQQDEDVVCVYASCNEEGDASSDSNSTPQVAGDHVGTTSTERQDEGREGDDVVSGAAKTNGRKKNDSISTCADVLDRCEEWAVNGGCYTNPSYAFAHCRESCRMCTLDSAITNKKAASSSFSSYHQQYTGGGYNGVAYPPTEGWQMHNYYLHGEDLGVTQSVHYQGGTKESDIFWRISQARNYIHGLTYEYFQENGSWPTSVSCRNLNPNCAWWAVVGECEEHTEFMQEYCAPVCFSCTDVEDEEEDEEYDYAANCPNPGNTTNVWEAGDVNRMFEKLTSEPYLSTYSVNILSSPRGGDGPWIITMDNVVSEEDANRLIELGTQMGYHRSRTVRETDEDSGVMESAYVPTRTSSNTWCQGICAQDKQAAGVIEILTNLTGIPSRNSEYLQLLRYETGEHYDVHHDYIPMQRTMLGGPRILTAYVYLNDVPAGGGTRFDQLNMTVMPKRGRVLLWPSVVNDDPEWDDDRLTHQALPVEEGTKYGANAWFHLRDFQTPYEHRCQPH